MRIFLDVTRTLVHSRNRTPTGIDRVEHAYVRYLLSKSTEDLWFIANTPFGAGALSVEEMRRVFTRIEKRHQVSVEQGPEFIQLLSVLASPIDASRDVPLVIGKKNSAKIDSKRSVAAAFVRGKLRLSRLLRDNVPTVYLHTSHLQLDEPKCFSWLRRPEIFPVFFIHDLIPIEFPEFCSPGADGRHRIRVHTALTHARALIVNSKFTRGSLLNYTQEKALPIGVVPLANSIRENDQRYEPYQLGNEPFFLHVGTIEGRKNLGHLLNVWRHLIKKMGSARAPRLVILGSRGWECENVTATLDRSRELANHVIEVSSANDAELHYLMRQANGLITVSMTEGFGLPPVEAVQLGLPVIASDIPAHREVLGSGCEFVAPHDGEALANKIIALTTNKIDGQAHGAGLAPFGWDDHVQQALSFINSVIAKSANSTAD